jgi:hypothetical protein
MYVELVVKQQHVCLNAGRRRGWFCGTVVACTGDGEHTASNAGACHKMQCVPLLSATPHGCYVVQHAGINPIKSPFRVCCPAKRCMTADGSLRHPDNAQVQSKPEFERSAGTSDSDTYGCTYSWYDVCACRARAAATHAAGSCRWSHPLLPTQICRRYSATFCSSCSRSSLLL